MGTIDWGKVAGSTGGGTGGAINWGAHAPGASAGVPSFIHIEQPKKPKPVEFTGRYGTVKEHAGNSLVGNLFSQTSDLISGIPHAVEAVGAATWHDLSGGKVHDQRLNSWAFLAEHPIAYADAWLHDPETFGGKVVQPQVEAVKTDVNALKRGDWHYFQQHPLNPIIDVAAAASLTGGGALRLARTGALGERAAELSTTERLLTVGDHTEQLRNARTLQGRIRQRAYDRIRSREGWQDVAFVGANKTLNRVFIRRVASAMIRAHLPIREFQRLMKPLTKAEVFAFHVAAEGVPLEERIAYYQARMVEVRAWLAKREKRLAKRPPKTRARVPMAERPIRAYLANLESPEVADVLANPRPEFLAALHAGAQVESMAGEALIQAGATTEDIRRERALMPQKEMAPPPPPPAAPPPAPPVAPPPPAPRPYVGSVIPPIVPPAAPATFIVTVKRAFHDDKYLPVRQKYLDAGGDPAELGLHEVRGTKGDNVRVRMDKKGLDIFMAAAKKNNGSSARASLLRIAAQMHKVEAALEKERVRLQWRRDKSGRYEVEGSDYHADPEVEHAQTIEGEHAVQTGRWNTYKGEEKLGGPFGTLAEAKLQIERDAHHRRTEAANAEAMAKSAAEPSADPFIGPLDAQTARGEAAVAPQLFHGTRERFAGDQPGDIYSTGSGAGNLYGHGFYTTDARDVASTYTRKGGATESQHVYGVHWQGEGKPNLLDLDAPVHPTVRKWAEAQLTEAGHGNFDVSEESFAAVEKALQEGTSGEVVRSVRKMWGSTGEIPKSEVDDMVSGLSDLLSAEGYDGLRHVGGNLAGRGKREHNVSIFFDTKKVKLSDASKVDWAQHAPESPVPPEEVQAAVEASPEAAQALGYELPERPQSAIEAVGPNRIHPDFPAPYRFWHTRQGVMPGQFLSPKSEQMLTKAPKLGQVKHNGAILLRNALMLTDPERVISRDALSTFRHLMIVQMQREVLDKIARPLDIALAASGFKKEKEFYYRPSYEQGATASIPRSVGHDQSLTQDRMVLDSEGSRRSVKNAAEKIVKEHGDPLDLLSPEERSVYEREAARLTPDERDAHMLETMNKAGIKRIASTYGKDFSREYMSTPWAIRNFYDRPLDVWRALTLNYRPAWMVNNFIGNAVMGLATYGPAGAAAYLRVLLATEKGDGKLLKLRNFEMRLPTRRRKYADVFDQVAPELHSAGLFGTQTKITHMGIYEGTFADFMDKPGIHAAGVAAKAAGGAVLKVGRGVTRMEVLFAEDTSREAAFLREAGGDIKAIREAAKKMGEGNISIAEALKRMDRTSVEKAVNAVNDALGNFNDLGKFERSILRRAIPFYSWFKVITKVSAKYAARYPARVLLMKNIADAQRKNGEPALPSWLRGSLLIGKPEHGTQTLISTGGLNPYETINQVATGGAGSVLSPFATSAVIGLTGVNPAFGTKQDYYGWGATTDSGWKAQGQEALGSLASGLAPARLYTQESQPYEGRLYNPHHYHAGPLSVSDFLLQYLGLPIRHVKLNEARKERGLR